MPQKLPELQASHEKMLREKHELELAKFEQECRNLPLTERVGVVAQGAIPREFVAPSLRGRVTVISSTSPEIQKVQSVFNSIFFGKN